MDAAALTKVYSCSVFETCDVLRFHKDGKRAYLVTNKGDATDLAALALFDPESGEVETVESDPLKRVDFGGAVFRKFPTNWRRRTIPTTGSAVTTKTSPSKRNIKWLATRLPGKEVGIASRTQDEQLWLVTATAT